MCPAYLVSDFEVMLMEFREGFVYVKAIGRLPVFLASRKYHLGTAVGVWRYASREFTFAMEEVTRINCGLEAAARIAS